jgi:hypothetical protein
MVTGSHASAYYGEPRFTRDIDIIADMNLAQVEAFIAYFPSNEFYCDKEMIEAEIKRRGQFNILHSASGLKIDIILTKTTPFSQKEFGRRKRSKLFPDQDTYFASPEDVIIKKMEHYKEGGSEKHLRDITGILKVSGGEINRAYIDEWAQRLDLIEVWESIQNRLNEKS